jgi:hypothetical protein
LLSGNGRFGSIAARFDHNIHIVLCQIRGDQCANVWIILYENDLVHVLRCAQKN